MRTEHPCLAPCQRLGIGSPNLLSKSAPVGKPDLLEPRRLALLEKASSRGDGESYGLHGFDLRNNPTRIEGVGTPPYRGKYET